MHKSVGTGCDFLQLNEMLMCDVTGLARKSENYMMDECSFLMAYGGMIKALTCFHQVSKDYVGEALWETKDLFPTSTIY